MLFVNFLLNKKSMSDMENYIVIHNDSSTAQKRLQKYTCEQHCHYTSFGEHNLSFISANLASGKNTHSWLLSLLFPAVPAETYTYLKVSFN